MPWASCYQIVAITTLPAITNYTYKKQLNVLVPLTSNINYSMNIKTRNVYECTFCSSILKIYIES